MEGRVCKHYQTGFCKFGAHCQKHHVIEMCNEEHCDKRICVKKHPNICKYFSLNHFCKFGDMCCYKHITSKNNSETVNLKIKTCIKNMFSQISNLENNIEELQKMSAPNVDFNCNECGYLASSETVLKRHITIKHLSKNPPEKLSDSVQDKFLQLSPGSEAR